MTKSITTEQVRRTRSTIGAELAEAQTQHDEAAYAAASDAGNEELREQLAAARRRLGVLTSELEGLEGVGRVVKQREAEEAHRADIEHRTKLFDAADAHAAELAAAVKAVGALLSKVGELRTRIQGLADQARNETVKASRGVIEPADLPYLLASLVQQDIPNAWDGMLQHHSVSCDRAGLSEMEAAMCATHMDLTIGHIKKGIEQTRERVLAAVDAAGPNAA